MVVASSFADQNGNSWTTKLLSGNSEFLAIQESWSTRQVKNTTMSKNVNSLFKPQTYSSVGYFRFSMFSSLRTLYVVLYFRKYSISSHCWKLRWVQKMEICMYFFIYSYIVHTFQIISKLLKIMLWTTKTRGGKLTSIYILHTVSFIKPYRNTVLKCTGLR